MRGAGFASVGTGLIASVVAHMMLLSVVAIPSHRQTAHGETVTVEIVRPDEAPAFEEHPAGDSSQPEAPKAEAPKAEPQPDFSKLQINPPVPNPEVQQQQQAQAARQRPQQQAAQQQQQLQQQPPQQQQPQQQQPQQQQQQPPMQQFPPQGAAQPPPGTPPRAVEMQTPETLQETAVRLSTMLGLPPPTDSGAEGGHTKADVDAQAIAAFKERLKSCWSPPAKVPEAEKTYVLIRVAFRRDGTLAGPPDMVGGSMYGPLLKEAAIAALKSCAPYSMFPAAKYNEWRVLDLAFPPDHIAKG